MSVFSKVYWIMAKAVRFCFWYIFVNILVLSFSTIIGLITNVVNQNIVNTLVNDISSGALSEGFIGFISLYMFLYFISKASGFLIVFGNNYFRFNVDELFHKIFMRKSYHTPQESFFDKEFMEKYSFISRNTSKISSYINNLCDLIFSNIAAVVGSIVLFAIYEPMLILYALMIAVIYVSLDVYTSKREYELDRKQIKERRFHEYYKELLTSKKYAKELRINHSKPFLFDKWKKIYNKLRMGVLDHSLHKITLRNHINVVKLLLRIIAVCVLLVGVYYKRYDIGTFVLLFGLVETCSNQINGLVNTVITGAYKDVKYLCDYYDFVMPISDKDIKQLQSNLDADAILPFGSFQELKVQNVSYTYPNGEKKAVENVSFSLKKGQIISVLGYNGSGKTTISKLMSGSLMPQEGIVTLNGVPICENNKTEVFRYFGLLPQEFSHFSISINEFVGLGFIEKMSDEKELMKAYEKSGAVSFISQKPKGGDTILGKEYDEEGTELSGGEWQQLSMAAAYMGEHEILIMDEPTASIDPLKEMEFIESFRKNLIGKTAVLISHRISFARLADKIIIMQNGRIVEEGTHDELLGKEGYYNFLFNEQKKLYEGE